MWPLEGMLAYY